MSSDQSARAAADIGGMDSPIATAPASSSTAGVLRGAAARARWTAAWAKASGTRTRVCPNASIRRPSGGEESASERAKAPDAAPPSA